MKEFMRIEHNKLLRLIAVFLMSLTALITAKQVAAEINALVPRNETDPLFASTTHFGQNTVAQRRRLFQR